jgi:DNA-binding transcriptional MocR family regulator
VLVKKSGNCICAGVARQPHTEGMNMSAHLNLYEHLANELGALIDSRVFAPGDRLPSIRHLAQQKRISVSTVMQALRLMEDRGRLFRAPPRATPPLQCRHPALEGTGLCRHQQSVDARAEGQ